jgi:hypothetical protein
MSRDAGIISETANSRIPHEDPRRRADDGCEISLLYSRKSRNVSFQLLRTQRGGSLAAATPALQPRHERRYAIRSRDGRCAVEILSPTIEFLRAAACFTCAAAADSATLVRRHFYYSAGRRFDAPRRLCKRDAAFAAFFLRMHAKRA